jgi:glycerophosphoryl diester phosphodiesterase
LDITAGPQTGNARRGPRSHGSPGLDRKVFLRPIAHRGLHSAGSGRLENTAPAFLAAIDKGYGIECDLQAAEDGTPMVFHDTTLDRLVAATGPIADYTPAKLARLRYKGQDERILTFTQFLELVGGRVPLLVEVKANAAAGRGPFLDRIARAARAYRGPIALMSFNRGIVAEFAARAPGVPRGRVVGSTQVLSALWARRAAKRAGPARSRLPEAAREGIAFYAVDVKLVAMARRWLTRNGLDLALFTWTVRTPRQRSVAARWADAPIFEGYEP